MIRDAIWRIMRARFRALVILLPDCRHEVAMLQIRRYFTSGLIALLTLVAALAIYVLITGELGWAEVRALLTALIGFAVGLNAVTCLTCRHEVPHPWMAWGGVVFGLVSGLMLLVLVWVNIYSSYYWQITSVSIIWTLVYTHCLLPSLIRLEGWQQRYLVPLTRASSLLLGALLSAGVIGSFYSSWLLRTISVMAILVGFFTLLLVILHRRTQQVTPRLILTESSDGLYMDASGRYYRVTPVE